MTRPTRPACTCPPCYRQKPAPVPEAPALVTPETWQDPGLLLIGAKGYAFRSYPGNPAAGCTRVVRLFLGNGFENDSYDVTFHIDRPAGCTCADATFRQRECKHVRAVVALDLHRAPIAVHETAGVPDLLDSDLELLEIPHPDDHVSRPF